MSLSDFWCMKWKHSVWDDLEATTEWQARWDAAALSFEVGTISFPLRSCPPPCPRKSANLSVSFDEFVQIRICYEDDSPFSHDGAGLDYTTVSLRNSSEQPTPEAELPSWAFDITHDQLQVWRGKPWRIAIGSNPRMARDDDVFREYLQPDDSLNHYQALRRLHPDAPGPEQARWLLDLWRIYMFEGEIIDEENTRELVLQTWFLDHERLRRNERPRMIALYDDYFAWPHLLRQLWQDQIRGHLALDVLIVVPDPPRSTLQRFNAHVILRQGLTDESATLLTAHCQGRTFDAQVQFASVAPQLANWNDIIGLFEMDEHCQQRLCNLRLGNTPQEEEAPPARIHDGMSILLTILSPHEQVLREGEHRPSVLMYPPEHGPRPGEDPIIAGVAPPDPDDPWIIDGYGDFIEEDIDRIAQAHDPHDRIDLIDDDLASLMSAPPVSLDNAQSIADMPEMAHHTDSPLEHHADPDEVLDDLSEADQSHEPGGDEVHSPHNPNENRYAAVIFPLQSAPIRTRIAFGDRNRFYDQVARLLFVTSDRLLYLHSVPHPPEDLIASFTTPMLAQLVGEQDEGEPTRYILVDVEFYPHMPSLIPEVVRTPKLIPTQVTRKQLLQMLGVEAFCRRAKRLRSGCLMWLNHHIVNTQYEGPIFLSSGDYLRVALPPDQEIAEAYTTREIAEICYHRNEIFATLGEAGRGMMPPLGNEIPFDIPMYYVMPSVYAEDDDDVSMIQQTAPSVALPLQDITNRVANSWMADELQKLKHPMGAVPFEQAAQEPSGEARSSFHCMSGSHPPFLVNWDLPLWVQQVQFQLHDFDRLRVEPEEEPADLVAATWMLNHAAIRFNPNERHVRLARDPGHWERQLRFIWRDLLQPDLPVVFHAVFPRPFRRHPHVVVDILLTQHPIEGCASCLVNVVEYYMSPTRVRPIAVVLPRILDEGAIIDAADMHQACPPDAPRHRCSARFGSEVIAADAVYPARDGACYDLHISVTEDAISTPSAEPQLAPDPEEEHTSMLQLKASAPSDQEVSDFLIFHNFGVSDDVDQQHFEATEADNRLEPWADSPTPFLQEFERLHSALQYFKFALENLYEIYCPDAKNQPTCEHVVEHLPAHPVLCLADALPSQVPFQMDQNAFEVFDRPNWDADFEQAWHQPLAPIPPGLHLHSSTWEALHAQWEHGDHQPHWLELYVDGSTHDDHAAWSVVVVSACDKGKRFCGCMAGSVQTDSDQADWLGATAHTNISAELSAAAVAFAYGLTRDDLPSVVRPDLQLSHLISTGALTVAPHAELGQLLHSLSMVGYPWIRPLEVRGHCGDPWNELADQLAKHYAKVPGTWGQVRWDHLHSLARSSFERQWAWLQQAPDHLRAAFPPLYEGQVWQLHRSHTQTLAPPPLHVETHDGLDLQFTALSYNVLALGTTDRETGFGSHRAMRLDSQLHGQKVAIAGLQEARTSEGVRMTDHFTTLSSGYETTGRAHHFGCELWLSKTQVIASYPGGSKVTLSQFKPLVLAADPRRLLVQLNGPFTIVCFVGHAPCVSAANSLDSVKEWWNEIATLLDKHAHNGYFLAFLDSNAPLASEETAHFGLDGAETMNPQGFLFQDFLQRIDLYAPATLGFHQGEHTTWAHPKGDRLRRDYCLVNRLLLDAVVHTTTCVPIDLGFTHEDHLPTAISFRAWTEASKRSPRLRWSQDKLRDPDTVEAFQAALRSLPMPCWDVPIDQHTAQMEAHLLALARQFFEDKGPPQRPRPMLREATINLIAFKRQVLDMMRSVSLEEKPEYKDHLKHIETQLRPMIADDQRHWYDSWLQEVQRSGDIHDHKMMFGKLTRLGRKKTGIASGPRPLPKLVLPDGEVARSVEQCQHTWDEQFARIEAGIHLSCAELLDVQNSSPAPVSDEMDIRCVPSIWDIQRVISGLRRGKAPGPNQLTADIIKAGGGPAAMHLCSAMVKAALGKQEPLSWKGGILVPLYKGKGRVSDPASYRAIYVSNITSKIYHGVLRSQVCSLWHQCIDAMQQGGRAQFGTDVSHHVLQAYLAWSRTAGKPMAVLFVDLHSAFYSVVRSTLFQESQGDDLLLRALDQLKITPKDLTEIMECVKADHALQGLSTHGQELLQDFFHASFYQMHHVPGVTMTTRGTRPGDPLGDVLFNIVFRLVMRDARQSFLQQTSLPWLGQPEPCSDLLQPGELPSSGFAQLAFVDDLACMLHSPTAAELPSLLALMTSCLHDAARIRGLRLNYTQGKTEAMVSIVGPGSRPIKNKIFNEDHRLLPVVAETEAVMLRVVSTYKHLGTHLQDRAVTTRDRQHRASCARKSAGQLLRPFFSKRRISAACKCRVFESLVISKHMFQVHVWSWVTSKEIDLCLDNLSCTIFAISPLTTLKPTCAMPLQFFTAKGVFTIEIWLRGWAGMKNSWVQVGMRVGI